MVQIDSISKAEAIKQQSRQLRGHIARDLADPAAPFDHEGYSLLKFHGVYQGYDRDSATLRKQQGLDKLWQFMVRVRIPGGRLTAAQYLALDALADRYANGSLRITTRQSIQFHGVLKAGLKSTIAAINAALLTTLAACGASAAAHPRLSRDLGRGTALAGGGGGGGGARPALRRALSAAQVQGRPRGSAGQYDRRVEQRPRDRRAVRGRAPYRLQFPAGRRPRDDAQQPADLSAPGHPGRLHRTRRSARGGRGGRQI